MRLCCEQYSAGCFDNGCTESHNNGPGVNWVAGTDHGGVSGARDTPRGANKVGKDVKQASHHRPRQIDLGYQ